MRLLKLGSRDEFSLTKDFVDDAPKYAILSHTWGVDEEEATFDDLENGSGSSKAGYAKLQFCGRQAKEDGLEYFWVDTCCINKANHAELSEAITSMFRWYRDAEHCYVYLSDVSISKNRNNQPNQTWEAAFRNSRWFTRGWTLQELIAPKSVKFFSQEEYFLGDKKMLRQQVQETTGIPLTVLSGSPLTQFSITERLRWAEKRNTKRREDQAYCLLGIFDVFIPLIYGEGDHAFIRLKEEIDKRSGASEPPAHVHWMVTRRANPLFTGREDLLQELDSNIRGATKNPLNRTQCRIVLSGMGGQGKSEICLQLAHGLRHLFWGVFWVDVSTASSAERSFLDIAQKLSIPAQTWDDACLGIANLKHPWLLVLDNADDPAVNYQDYFPDGTQGVVMITSRNHECQQYATAQSIALEGLSKKGAQELLLKAARVPLDQYSVHQEDAAMVASLLQSHPLALIQAGAYVSRGHCTLAEYPRVFTQQRRRLLTFRPAQAQSRYRDVYATFEASADILQSSSTQSAEDALQLLPVLATCGPNRVPLPLFDAGWKGARSVSSSDAGDDEDVIKLTLWHVSHLLPFMQTDADRWDSFRLVEAVYLLKALSLVSTDTYSGFLSVSMHPLTHAWARDRQERTEQHESWVSTGCLIAISRDDRAFWRQHGGQLQPHVQALVAWEISKMFTSEPPMEITSILVNCGWLLYDMRDDTKLFNLMYGLFTYLDLDRNTVDRSWLAVYDLTARNLVNYGKVKEAVLLLEQVVKIREQTLADDHPDQLNSQRELAGAYRANGKSKEAVSLLEQIVKVREQTLPEDHPDRLTSQHELTSAYQANGQIQKAVSVLEQLVNIREKILTEDHADRLHSQHELARAYQADGQVGKAVELLEHVVAVREKVLVEEHPDRLSSQHALARAYQADGQVGKAVELLEHVVAVHKKELVKEHPSRLTSQHTLALAYQADGQTGKAVELLEDVLTVRGKELVEEHPDLLTSQHALAIIYQADGQVGKAVELLEHVVAVGEKVLVEEHPDRLASQHALAITYEADGQVGKAVELLEHVMAVRGKVLVEEHPDRLASQHALAIAYQADGQVGKAVELLEHVVAVRGKVQVEEHPDRLASQRALARAYQADGQVGKAVELLEHVVAVHAILVGKHPSRVASLHALATAYQADGQVPEAVLLLEQVVRIEEQTLAEDHPDRLTSRHVLAMAYQENGQVTEAVSLLEQVVKIREQTLTQGHPDRLASQQVLATIFWDLGRRNVALQMMKHVAEIQRQVLDEHHPDRINCEAWVEQFESENSNTEPV